MNENASEHLKIKFEIHLIIMGIADRIRFFA